MTMYGTRSRQTPTSMTRDVLVLQTGADPRLAAEPGLEVVVHAGLRPVAQELERHPLAQLLVGGGDHHTHRAATEHLVHPVLAVDHRPDGQLAEECPAFVLGVDRGGGVAQDRRGVRSLARLELAAGAARVRLLLLVGRIARSRARVRRVRRHDGSILRGRLAA
jgi:hypothetical protein